MTATVAAIQITIDGRPVAAAPGSTILDACRSIGEDQPTLCYLENLTPVNVCRVCVVEVEGSRTLVPSCSRPVEEGMAVATDSERVRHSRKMVLEFLASSTDLSTSDAVVDEWMERYGADPDRYGEPAPAVDDRDSRGAGHHHIADGLSAETAAPATEDR